MAVDPIEEAIASLFGAGVRVTKHAAAGGGCINRATLLTLSNGESLFLKENSGAHPGLFRAEAQGLVALAGHDAGSTESWLRGKAKGEGHGEAAESGSSPGTEDWIAPLREGRGIRVPMPLFLHEDPKHQFLLMERIAVGDRRPDFWQELGRSLATLHRCVRNDRFGFIADNFIGSTPQPNGWEGDWPRFFGEKRLRFQARLAVRRGAASAALNSEIDSVIRRLPSLFPAPEHASLLHGDLWGGNLMLGPDGTGILIDPAVYFGHREADLAMTELFGGFDSRFYAAYREAWPLDPGYEERRDLYNLYHLLNHLNLFGASYLGSVRSILARYR